MQLNYRKTDTYFWCEKELLNIVVNTLAKSIKRYMQNHLPSNPTGNPAYHIEYPSRRNGKGNYTMRYHEATRN